MSRLVELLTYKKRMYVFLGAVILSIIIQIYINPLFAPAFPRYVFAVSSVFDFFLSQVIMHLVFRIFSKNKPRLRDKYMELIIYQGVLTLCGNILTILNVSIAFIIRDIIIFTSLQGLIESVYYALFVIFWAKYYKSEYGCHIAYIIFVFVIMFGSGFLESARRMFAFLIMS